MRQRKQGILLASFVYAPDEEEEMRIINEIINNVEFTNKYIFVLAEKDNPDKKVITYNTNYEGQTNIKEFYYTIRVHRKKKTNTLYTINGLNLALEKEHNGKRGKDLKLNWEEHRGTIIMSQAGQLKVLQLELQKIIEIETD